MSHSRPPPNVEGMTSLKVDNLTYRTSPNTLRRVFQKYGPIGDVYIPRDRFTRKSRGFAFVRFHHKHHAEDAMDALDGIVLDGRELRVQMARYGRPLDFHHSYRWETSPHRRSPSTSKSRSTQRSNSKSSSVSRSSSLTRSRSRSRSFPPGYEKKSNSRSPSKSISDCPKEGGAQIS
ncbi:Serine/arginine-rich splicing factor 2 [Sciurus carolinensis]|uniref:Serine/arginine-rich splicing factor 2 n=1 Tax=Sciurus carolinensis TaxID=30640 RepID=A0AA41N422_SCICA|nr:Serine/arginine-rich splicing factor 2 [Sciurus carolinensis]